MGTSDPLFRQLLDYESFTYTYILADTKTREAVIIDPVKEQKDRDLQCLRELQLKLLYIIDTHIHADHITGASDLREATGAKACVGKEAQVSCADHLFSEGDVFKFGAHELKILATPGHTDASYSFLVGNKIFTGDALLIRGCGRTDFQSGSSDVLYESIVNKLFKLPPATLVYPAHDYRGHMVSSIEEEKMYNPRLGGGRSKDDFVKMMSELKLADPKKIHEAIPANMLCGKAGAVS